MNLTEITNYDLYEVEATLTYDLCGYWKKAEWRLEVKIWEKWSNTYTILHQSQDDRVRPDNDYLSWILKHQKEFYSFYIEYKVTAKHLSNAEIKFEREYTVQIDPKTAKITWKKIK